MEPAPTGSAPTAGRAVELAGCEAGRQCPIMLAPCPGECVFAEIMESQQLGVVVFDLADRSLPFVNRSARELFERLDCLIEYRALFSLLVPDAGLLTPAGYHPDQPIRVGSRLLGHTVYRSRNFAWAFVRDVTERARLE